MSPILPAFHPAKPHTHPLQVRAGACSLQGARRENNEDCQFISAERDLFIVADGMGGHAAGEVASQFAVNALSLELGHLPDDVSDQEVEEYVHAALERTHCLMLDLTASSREYAGADTTVVLALLMHDRLYVTGVGDSRAYLIRGQSIQRLTTDDTIPDQLLQLGQITETQARHHYLRNRLLSSLGAQEFQADKEIHVVTLQSGDCVMLSSDGLTDVLTDDELLRVIRANAEPQRAAEELTRAAVAASAGDDITCVVFSVLDPKVAQPPARATAAQHRPPPGSETQEHATQDHETQPSDGQHGERQDAWIVRILRWFGRQS